MINRIAGLEGPAGRRRKALPDGPRSGPPGGGAAWEDFRQRAEKYIGDHPVMSLAVGLTIGIVIGCLIKRR